MSGSFVHLHCHSHYSLLDGANQIPPLIKRVKDLGMNAVALTDHGNLYGAIEFYTECRNAGLNPIIGYEAYIAPGKRTDREYRKGDERYYHLTLLARNRTGLKNLIKMASSAFLEGFYSRPRIDKELLAGHKEGLICLSGCLSSEFSRAILRDQLDEARDLAGWFAKLFGENNFFVEVQNNGLEIQKTCSAGAMDIAKSMGLPIVATCDAHYLTSEHAPAHDILLCIGDGRLRTDEKRRRYGSDQFYVRAPKEVYDLFPDRPDAVAMSQQIADGCDIQIDLKARHFPVFTPPEKKTPEAYLRELCLEGLKKRYGEQPPQTAIDRMEHELGVICRMGFAGYFLIVGDFVRFAREHHIPASARGSACGALVSYVLELSHVDPLEYDLLFERFLDPNRSEAPDIDIDFCQERREEVIAYVRKKYGEQSVAQIGTFGTLAAKAAVKDVGRVLDVPLERVIQLTKLIPGTPNITIDEALDQNADFRREYETDPAVRELIDLAKKLEGTNRNAGTHAAGVVIANGPLTDYVPIQRVMRKGASAGEEDGKAASGAEALLTTQWEMNSLEKVGMLKMDFLGLRTLTLLDRCLKLIEKTRGQKIDLFKDLYPHTDPKTYALLQRGDAKGVFQLESEGIRDLLKRMRPDNIRDLIAIMALYRPGPLQGGMVDAYVNRKHGREKTTYQHPFMEEILAETYGVLVYQEQCMRILNRLGGIELASAYACVKAISKKKQEIIDKRREEFLKGAQERGLSEATAREIFELITFFAGYGFNKCVAGETVLVDAATGERTTVLELFRNRRPFQVHALGEDGRLRPRLVTDVVFNGVKKVFRLRTAQGKEIVATGNHPFRTLNGWTNLAQLRPGDRIAAPRHLTVTGAETSWPRHELIALAGLLSEGNTCHRTCLYFYGNDPVLIDDFAVAASAFPDSVARIDRHKGRTCMEVCVNTGRNFRFRKNQRPWNAGGSSDGSVVLASAPIRSGMFQWAERVGVLRKKAPEKRVPAEVFRLPDPDIALFLGRLWAGDGFIANATQFTPYYATSSRQLAHDVQLLLLRLGILAGIHAKSFNYRNSIRPGYTVHLVGEQSAESFLEKVAPHALGRERAIDLLTGHLRVTCRGMASKDTIPPAVRSWVDEERRKAGLTWKDLEERSGVSMQEFSGMLSPLKRGFRRSTLARLARFFGSERLAQIAQSDIFWDRIVAIEPAGLQKTFDLTVEGDHNFVADGLVVHNSHTAAYAQVGYQTAYLKANYTPEFMAALLSSEIDDSNKRDIMVEHIDDARRLGVEVLPPDANEGDVEFTVKSGKILFGLTAIKGVGRGAAGEVVRARAEKGPFRDLFDFCERIDTKLVPKPAIERLIKAGAMDCLALRRRQLMEGLPRAWQAAEDKYKLRSEGYASDLFGGEMKSTEEAAAPVELPDVPEWSATEKLRYEKESLDFYFSSHPLAHHAEDMKLAANRVEQIAGLPANQEVLIGGMLTSIRYQNTKKARNGNSRYARCKVEDLTGSVECVMWPDDFVRCKDEFQEDRPCFVKGVVERNREEPSLVLSRVMSIEQGRKELARNARSLYMQLLLTEHSPDVVNRLLPVLQETRGNCPVLVDIFDPEGNKVRLRASSDFSINPVNVNLGRLEEILGKGRVRLVW